MDNYKKYLVRLDKLNEYNNYLKRFNKNDNLTNIKKFYNTHIFISIVDFVNGDYLLFTNRTVSVWLRNAQKSIFR